MFQSSVQIAGVKSTNEAKMLEDLNTDFIGFPLRLGYHRPDTSENEAREIISQLKVPSRAVLITYLTDAREVETFARYLGVATVQLHGDIGLQQAKTLRENAPDIAIIKSLIVRPECIDPSHPIYSLAQEFDPYVDAFITDTYDPQTGATGATGMRHDWRVSARVRDLIRKPLILAGGLTPENVFDAIQQVRPAAVDAHTGVEDHTGGKSFSLVSRFINEAKRGFAQSERARRVRED